MGLFKIYKDRLGEYRVFLKVNNRIEFISISHKRRVDCFNTINLIRKSSYTEKAFQIEIKPCGSYLFKLSNILTSENVGESETYVNL